MHSATHTEHSQKTEDYTYSFAKRLSSMNHIRPIKYMAIKNTERMEKKIAFRIV